MELQIIENSEHHSDLVRKLRAFGNVYCESAKLIILLSLHIKYPLHLKMTFLYCIIITRRKLIL